VASVPGDDLPPDSIHLPSPWQPVAFSPNLLKALPLSGAQDAFYRCVPDPECGLPYLVVEVFGIEAGVLQVARCSGWTLPRGEQVGLANVLTLREFERISLERVVEMDGTLGSLEGRLVLTGGEARTDLPVALILSHLNGGAGGYARSSTV
jgi:hypothetical protein